MLSSKSSFPDLNTPLGRALYLAFYFHDEQPPPPPPGLCPDWSDSCVSGAFEGIGVDHIGLGADYDGGFAFPSGLETVSGYPLLSAELLRRGYSDGDVEKIIGGAP
jgi:hypothetical protein